MSDPAPGTVTCNDLDIRVRYCEVDRMGTVHHSRYAVYFEMGRTELLRCNGSDYRTLEDAGALLVVARLETRFRAPARYDDLLRLTTTLVRADHTRIEHEYLLLRPLDSVRIAEGKTTLVCVDRQGRLQRIPEFLRLSEDAAPARAASVPRRARPR